MKSVAGAPATYTWDAKGRLTVAQGSDGSVTTCAHDAFSLRRSKQAAPGTVRSIRDGHGVLLATDGNGTTQAAYAQTRDAHRALASQRRGNATVSHHPDALASTMELKDASQAVTRATAR